MNHVDWICQVCLRQGEGDVDVCPECGAQDIATRSESFDGEALEAWRAFTDEPWDNWHTDPQYRPQGIADLYMED